MNLKSGKVLSINLILFICCTLSTISLAQEANITPQLKLIESGQIKKAQDDLNKLKLEYPRDPSVLYLDATLTTDAKDAISKYTLLSDKYPQSKYADAALFKVYSYYYALGLYSSAKNIFEKLSKSYPQSQYIKLAEKRPVAEPFVSEINSPLKDNVPAVVTSKTSEKASKKFTIQAGAFLNADNAKRLKDAFIEDGYASEIKLKEVAGSTLSIVSVGSFQTEEEAKSALLLINERYKLNGRVIQLEQ